jgi:hypothetical protein
MRKYDFHQMLKAAVLCLTLAMLTVGTLSAQTALGSISGIVSDPNGLRVPGAKIIVTDIKRGLSYSRVSNATGFYQVTDLIPSTYRISAEKSSFQTYVVDSFPLITQQEAVLNIPLQVGSTKQEVTVLSQTQMIEPANATLGGVVPEELVTNLPLVSRNVLTLTAILPGVQPSTPNSYSTTFYTYANRYSISGGLEDTEQILLDGVTTQTPGDVNGAYNVALQPSPDSIEAMRVETNDFSAAYGRSGGGLVTMETKSGTNAFHGDAYDFLRNDALDANGFFSNLNGAKRPPLRHNDYGFTFGGPVIKNRTFFFFSFEGVAETAGRFTLFTVPTAAERSGDFSQDLDGAGDPITIYNPFSTRPDPSSPGNYVRDPFPNNQIPSSLMDSVALKALSYYPLPNQSGLPNTHLNNLSLTNAVYNPAKEISTRIDHNFSDTKRLFARYNLTGITSGDVNWWGNAASPVYGNLPTNAKSGVLGYTETFGSSTVLDLRAAYNRFTASRTSFGYPFDMTSLGLPADLQTYVNQGTLSVFPTFAIGGYTQLGPAAGVSFTGASGEWDFLANVMRTFGRHTLQAGIEYIPAYDNLFYAGPGFSANFSQDMTQGPNPLIASSTAGDSFAAFLLGTGDGGGSYYSAKPATANRYLTQYIEDDVKVGRNLTLNIGFRLEEETALTERHNRLDAIDLNVTNPISNQVPLTVQGGYVFAGSGPDSLGRRALAPIEIKPNPRIGLAYSLNGKTVIRAAYGIFYGVPQDGPTNAFTGAPWATGTTWQATLDGITPNDTLSNPFPNPNAFVYPPGTGPGLLTGVGGGLDGPLPSTLKDMYNQQWNLTIQRSFTQTTMLQVAYAGNKATHIGDTVGVELDQLPPQDLAQGTALLQLVPNPFNGIATGGSLGFQSTVQAGQLLRPYPGWTDVTAAGAGEGNSEYESGQVLFEKRLSKGNSLLASYTWSKTMADLFDGSFNNLYGGGANTVRNWYCIKCEHSPSIYDVPHRFVLSSTYNLPFGRGERFGSGWNGFEERVLGGWQIGGILTLASGMPLEFSTAENTSYSFGGNQHPNTTGISARVSNKSFREWFNPAAFVQPAPFTFGNLGRTFTAVREDWTRNLDFSLLKDINITEKSRLQLRGEAFNLTNTTVFSAPGQTVGTSSLGVISGQSNGPRTIQVSGKIIF